VTLSFVSQVDAGRRAKAYVEEPNTGILSPVPPHGVPVRGNRPGVPSHGYLRHAAQHVLSRSEPERRVGDGGGRRARELSDVGVQAVRLARREHAGRARDELHRVPVQVHGVLAAVEVVDDNLDDVAAEHDVRVGVGAVDSGVGGVGARGKCRVEGGHGLADVGDIVEYRPELQLDIARRHM
jgi:hypothetical protein